MDERRKQQDRLTEQFERKENGERTCDDCISRQAVLDLFAQNCDAVRPYHKTWSEVKKLPSVNPQPKTGRWIPTYGNVKCSVCGSVKDSRDVGKATHYCDFCGARMVEPQESEV